MNANMVVDMGAALLLCSAEKAKQLGIDEEKWVYPLSLIHILTLPTKRIV